jgi:Core binding factor beta subunit
LIGISFGSQVRYTGFRDRPQEERKLRFANGCREGHTEIALVTTGINLQLSFNSNPMMYHHHHQHMPNYERELDFDKEHGKVRSRISSTMEATKFQESKLR